MDWMEQEQERGITITSAATTCFWARESASTSSTRPATSTSRPRSSARCACSTAPWPCSTRSPASSRSPRPSGARPTSTASPHLLRQQDGPHRRGLPALRRDDRTKLKPTPRDPDSHRLRRQVTAGVIDLVKMKAINYKDETMGAELRRRADPRRHARRGGALPRAADREGRRVRRHAPREVPARRQGRDRRDQGGAAPRRRSRGSASARHLRLGLQEQGRAAAARRGRRLPAVAARRPADQGARRRGRRARARAARTTGRSRRWPSRS